MFNPASRSLADRYRIEEAVSLLQDYPFVASSHMIVMLESLEFERDIAAELVVYIPMAYLRVLLASQHVRFPDTCQFYNNAGEAWTVNVNEELLYEASLEYARHNIAQGMQREHIQGIILRSCEFPAVKFLLEEGIAPQNLDLEPAVVNLDGEDPAEPEPEPENELPATSWWKFW